MLAQSSSPVHSTSHTSLLAPHAPLAATHCASAASLRHVSSRSQASVHTPQMQSYGAAQLSSHVLKKCVWLPCDGSSLFAQPASATASHAEMIAIRFMTCPLLDARARAGRRRS